MNKNFNLKQFQKLITDDEDDDDDDLGGELIEAKNSRELNNL